MKKTQFYLLVLILFAALPACGTNSSADDDDTGMFDVPFEMFIPATQQSDGTWIVANGRFIATFKERKNVTHYELQVIREDNSKGEPFIYDINQLRGHRPPGSDLIYSVAIGSSFSYSGVNDDEKNELVEKIQQELDENKHLYRLLEVIPL